MSNTYDTEKIAFKIYPNPVVEDLTIEGDLRQKIVEVYNLEGRLLQSVNSENEQMTVPFNNYAAGAYLITVTDFSGKKLATQKIIKK